MKRLLSILFLSLAATVVRAEDITVHVDGMVCSFCAQGIIKKFQEQPGVDKVKVNLDDKAVYITTKENATLSDKSIRQAVDWAGYTVVDIQHAGGSK